MSQELSQPLTASHLMAMVLWPRRPQSGGDDASRPASPAVSIPPDTPLESGAIEQAKNLTNACTMRCELMGGSSSFNAKSQLSGKY